MIRFFILALMSLNLVFCAIPTWAQLPLLSENAETNNASIAGAFSKLDTDHVIGSNTAPVTMILYASITCPHCASWFKSDWPSLKRDYVETGKLQIVFREYLTAPAQFAFIGFQIANCAPPEDYFTIITHQMVNQDDIFTQLKAGNGEQTYLKIANMAGLKTVADMNACINNPKGRSQIEHAGQLATAGEIPSVPAAIIAGEKYKGNLSYLHLSRFIDNLSTQSFTPMPKQQDKPGH